MAPLAPTELSQESYCRKRYAPVGGNIITQPGTLKILDKRYKYEGGRTLSDYDEKLGHLFIQFRENLKTKKDVKVLDSGAGKGNAMVGLTEKVDSINKCVCVTKHDFNGTHIPKNPKIEWIFGRSQSYLEDTDLRFNLITDVFGAYAYSSEKNRLVELYHNRLTLNGKAFIYLGSKNYQRNRIYTSESSYNFEKWLAGAYPHVFLLLNEERVLVITRCFQEEIDLELKVTKVRHFERESTPSLPEDDKIALDYYRPCEVDLEFTSFSDQDS